MSEVRQGGSQIQQEGFAREDVHVAGRCGILDAACQGDRALQLLSGRLHPYVEKKQRGQYASTRRC